MSTTLAPASDPPASPSPSDLQAVFSPDSLRDSEDEMDDDEDAQSLLETERTFKDSVHGLSASAAHVSLIAPS